MSNKILNEVWTWVNNNVSIFIEMYQKMLIICKSWVWDIWEVSYTLQIFYKSKIVLKYKCYLKKFYQSG